MKRLLQVAGLLVICTTASKSVLAKEHKQPPLPLQILNASTVYLDCDCRKEMAASIPNALPELLAWGRYKLAPDRHHADLILLYSMNEYLGDYFTRDGPDKRPADVDFTILTVIDGHTGQELWSESKRWGYMLVGRASRDLMDDFRVTVESQVKDWTLEDILNCGSNPIFAAFAHLTRDQALLRSGVAIEKIPDSRNLAISSPSAPGFCSHAQLMVGEDNQINGFEVLPTRDQGLALPDLMEHADRFDFSSGKAADADKVYFTAETKDKKTVIRFDMEGRQSVLTRVTYLY